MIKRYRIVKQGGYGIDGKNYAEGEEFEIEERPDIDALEMIGGYIEPVKKAPAASAPAKPVETKAMQTTETRVVEAAGTAEAESGTAEAAAEPTDSDQTYQRRDLRAKPLGTPRQRG